MIIATALYERVEQPIEMHMSRSNSLTYWQRQKASIQGMMLNPEADELHYHEHKQIISCLPDLSGKDILELGAGIGRFTTYFASQADSVTAVDFNQNFIDKNKEINAYFANISYQCDDAINLSFAKDKFDFVFINWLFMYLEDDQVEIIIKRITQWLKPKGHFFLRESCITDSKGNPPLKSTTSDSRHSHFHSHYRDPQFYLALLSKNFNLVFQGNIKIYEQKYNNPNQLFWLFKKN
ncbi:MAG: methyltransferase domain-containing protein [Symploca sp. SIO2G7]|nr:methyltransferase domain-containing protein [Symploca sp. SIO2G7]